MKNLSKKIGVGVVASSLVVGGAMSTGLVANADTSVEQSQITQSQENENLKKLDGLGDLQTIKLAKQKYGFDVFGYYFANSSTSIRKMKLDIDEVANYVKGKNGNNSDNEFYKKIKSLEETLPGELLTGDENGNFKVAFDLKCDDGKAFMKNLYTNGMQEGVRKVKVGDAILILVLQDTIPAKKDWSVTEDELNELKNSYLDINDIDGRWNSENVLENISNFLIKYNNSSSVSK